MLKLPNAVVHVKRVASSGLRAVPTSRVVVVVVSDPCAHGSCITLEDGSYFCECRSGYTGERQFSGVGGVMLGCPGQHHAGTFS